MARWEPKPWPVCGRFLIEDPPPQSDALPGLVATCHPTNLTGPGVTHLPTSTTSTSTTSNIDITTTSTTPDPETLKRARDVGGGSQGVNRRAMSY